MGVLLGAVGEPFFSATYFDPVTGAERTMDCRCGEKSSGVLIMRNGEPVWSDVDMELSE